MLSLQVKQAIREYPNYKDLILDLDRTVQDRKKDTRSAVQKFNQLFKEGNDKDDRS